MSLMLSLVLAGMAAGTLPVWNFEQDTEGWVPNGHLAEVGVQKGILRCRAVNDDPMFILDRTEFDATPWQFVAIRIKADRDGQGELFWTAQTAGPFGGFSADKSTRFAVVGDGQFHTVTVFPFWQAESAIRRLRLDLYDATRFEIDSIEVCAWDNGAKPQESMGPWTFDGKLDAWKVSSDPTMHFAPPLNAAVKDINWATVMVSAEKAGVGELLWATSGTFGIHGARFDIQASERPLPYTIELEGLPEWRDKIVAVGLRMPASGARVESLTLAAMPQGPPWLTVDYFGAENAGNRAEAACSVFARIRNRGGSSSANCPVELQPGSGLKAVGPVSATLRSLEPGDTETVRWEVVAEKAGEREVTLRIPGLQDLHAKMKLAEPLHAGKQDYVPEPKPLKTALDVCAYYFPGWDTDAKWECIRKVAPIRKPLLGYYDESKVECVDWQIKWAVENGITCFLVDWYWSSGQQMLTHWFDAYRQAKYRDLLKVAIMWANHNAPYTHSAEDWRAVTRQWIDRYFNLPAYYKVDGKPVVMIWAPENLRRDLKGPEAVKASLEESQEMARQAGYPGIHFVAMNDPISSSRIATLAQEGYAAITNYHEWGAHATTAMVSPGRMSYEQLVKDAPAAWEEKLATAKPLDYWPVADTGWDSRPWHGAKSFVIEDRTPARFEALAKKVRRFAEEHGHKQVVIGPLNEWGEGSYIEPCTEFGFEMYEALARAFAEGDGRHAQNLSPADVGLGPYGYRVHPPVTAWDFAAAESGWRGMMGVSTLESGSGRLTFTTTSEDPAIVANVFGVQAKDFSRMTVSMQITGALGDKANGQLFWTSDRDAESEAASATFDLERDGQPHDYVLNLAEKPRWRGRIATLRFDPCNQKDLRITILSMRFEK